MGLIITEGAGALMLVQKSKSTQENLYFDHKSLLLLLYCNRWRECLCFDSSLSLFVNILLRVILYYTKRLALSCSLYTSWYSMALLMFRHQYKIRTIFRVPVVVKVILYFVHSFMHSFFSQWNLWADKRTKRRCCVYITAPWVNTLL